MVTKEQFAEEERRASIAFINQPEKWPLKSGLPMKRRTGVPGELPDHCVILHPPFVAGGPAELHSWADDTSISKEPVHTYGSAAECVADGWVVD